MPTEEQNYRVIYPERVRQQTRSLLMGAKEQEDLALMKEALRVLDQRLRDDPLSFGEQVAKLKIVGWIIQVGFVRPLLVDFAIDEQRKFVFVKRIKTMTAEIE